MTNCERKSVTINGQRVGTLTGIGEVGSRGFKGICMSYQQLTAQMLVLVQEYLTIMGGFVYIVL